jgi:hypothetical protein
MSLQTGVPGFLAVVVKDLAERRSGAALTCCRAALFFDSSYTDHMSMAALVSCPASRKVLIS